MSEKTRKKKDGEDRGKDKKEMREGAEFQGREHHQTRSETRHDDDHGKRPDDGPSGKNSTQSDT
jgi:hypothetical protein